MANSNKKLLKALHERLTPYEFENYLLDLLNEMGFQDCEVTQYSGDSGIDLTGRWENNVPGLSTDMDFVIQAKRFKPITSISPKYVRELRGTLTKGEMGLLITTARATDNTIEEGLKDPLRQVSVIDGEKLIELCKKYEVGFKKRYEINLGEYIDRDEKKIEKPSQKSNIKIKTLLSKSLSKKFERVGNSPIYKSSDYKIIFHKSKYYENKSRDYWFSITQKDFDRIDEQNISYIAFGCGNEGVALIPSDKIKKEVSADNLNATYDSEGQMQKIHIVFKRAGKGEIYWIKKAGNKEKIKFHRVK